MRAGRLRHRITIYQPSGFPPSWSELDLAWSLIEPVGSGGEQTSLRSPTETRIKMRYRSDVTSAMIVYYGSRIFSIDAIANTAEQNREMILTCHEYIGRSIVFNDGTNNTSCIGFFIQNAEIIHPDTYTLDRRRLCEIPLIQLSSLPKAGNTITLASQVFTVKGITESGDDAKIVRVIL